MTICLYEYMEYPCPITGPKWVPGYGPKEGPKVGLDPQDPDWPDLWMLAVSGQLPTYHNNEYIIGHVHTPLHTGYIIYAHV